MYINYTKFLLDDGYKGKNHFIKGGTGITNFYPEELEFYEKSIVESNHQDILEIKKEPMDKEIGSGFSLHFKNNRSDLSKFWKVFNKIKYNK